MWGLCLLVFGGCDQLLNQGAADDASAPAEQADEQAAEGPSAEDVAEQAKLSAAIECLNRHSGRVFEARHKYSTTLEERAGREDPQPLMLGLYAIDACQSKIEEARAVQPPVAELDAASTAYVAALTGLAGVYEEVSGYYEKGEHLDDQGAKGKTLHPKLTQAFEHFAAAHEKLDAEVQTRNRARRVAELAAREEAQGRDLEVVIDSMMLEAETLIAMTSKTPGPELSTLEKQITAYGKLVDEVDAYAKAHPDEVKRGSMTNLKNYSKAFLAAVKVIARKRRDTAEPSDGERAETVSQYNALVDNYNRG